VAEITAHHDIHQQLTTWKSQLLHNAAVIFGGNSISDNGRERIRELNEKIGELVVERDASS
jgi:hypothetical protein